MPTAFQLRTLPEILTQMFATSRVQLGDDTDLNIGSILRTLLEASALQDAEQYIQIARLLDLFSLDEAKGDDLDQRAKDLGADIFPEMRRRGAQTSISEVVVGDGTFAATSKLSIDIAAGVTSFAVLGGEGAAFPLSGVLVLERATEREEEVIYTRVGDTFTIVSPATGTVNPHLVNGSVDQLATKSIIDGAVIIGGGSAVLESGTEVAWPAAGTIIFERDTVRRESFTFTRVGTTVTLTSGTFAFAHADDTDVHLSTFGSDRAITLGTAINVPASAASVRVDFLTTEAGTLLDGDLVSALIDVESEAAGADTRVGANTLVAFSSPPFSGATVTNPFAVVRGRDRENDDAYRERLRDFIQSLNSGSALSIETALAGRVDTFSGRIIAFAQVVEPVSPGESTLYVTDGSVTFSIDFQVFAGRDVLISDADLGDARSRLNNLGPFKEIATPLAMRTPRIFKSLERGVADSVGADFLEDSTQTLTPGAHVGQYLKTDDDQFYLITANTAIRFTISAGGATPSLGAYAVIDFTASPLEPGVDYDFSQSTGELELTVALVANDALVAADDGAAPSVGAYTYTRGLAAFAQRLVNGDPSDLQNFPGLKSTGTQVLVTAPTVISPSFTVQVVTASGVTDADLEDTVKGVIQAYVNGLGIGDNIILSEIIRLVKGLAGVNDTKLLAPTSNVSVPDGQLARIDDTNITVV